MAEAEKEQASSTTTTPSAESTPVYQHPSDHSFNLQFLLDIKGAISKLEERTARLQQDIAVVQSDVKGLPGRGSYWAGIGLIISVMLGLAGIYWSAQPKDAPTAQPQSTPTLKTQPATPAPPSPTK